MSIRLLTPVPGGTFTDGFGWRPAVYDAAGRLIVGPQLHTGQDIAAPRGTPVLAAHPGRINKVWWDAFPDGSPAGGNMLQIGSAQVSTRYAHLNAYAVNLGDEVRAGQVIGYVGRTGAATGDHLHLELLFPGGQYVDPMPYLTATPTPEPDRKRHTMLILDDNRSIYIVDEWGADHLGDPDIASKDIDNGELIACASTLYGAPVHVNNRQRDVIIAIANRRWARKQAAIAARLEAARKASQ